MAKYVNVNGYMVMYYHVLSKIYLHRSKENLGNQNYQVSI